jgi:menaquinone-dependent protoporphyrinogen oxidase
VIYGTTEGQTRKIADAIGDTMREHGATVDVVHARGATVSPMDYAGVVVAASVHVGGYQRSVRSWVRRHASDLATRPTAFVSVCLGVLQDEPAVKAELKRILDRFFAATGWRPQETSMVAGALPYTKYGWLKRWIMKRIVRKAGGDVDTTRDYEYTDWPALRAFAEAFSRRVSGAAEASSVRSRAIA